MTFKAHNYINNTSAQNKGVAIRRLRATRTPRVDVGSLGDLKNWVGGDVTWRDLEAHPPAGLQWASNMHKKDLVRRTGTYTWNNIGVTGQDRSLKWGTREYNTPYRRFIDCDFTDIDQEHGLYVSNSSGTVLHRCTFLRCGSQGAQFAHRDGPYQQYGADNMPYDEKPRHGAVDCHFVDCGFEGTRPSFNLTYFSPGSSEYPARMAIRDSSFVANWSEERYDGKKSTGAIVVCPQQGGPELNGRIGPMVERLEIKNCLFDYTAGDREICSLRSIGDLIIEDSVFIARSHQYAWLTIDKDYSGDDLGGAVTERIVLRDIWAQGVTLKLMLPRTGTEKQQAMSFQLHCPGKEVVIDARRGRVLAESAL